MSSNQVERFIAELAAYLWDYTDRDLCDNISFKQRIQNNLEPFLARYAAEQRLEEAKWWASRLHEHWGDGKRDYADCGCERCQRIAALAAAAQQGGGGE